MVESILMSNCLVGLLRFRILSPRNRLKFLSTTRKWSLWRLCFHRCLSVHGRGGHTWWGGMCAWGCMAGGDMRGGGTCVVGHAWQEGMCGGGDMHGRGCAWQGGGMRGRKDGHCSGQYPSYWNAFLLALDSWITEIRDSQSFCTQFTMALHMWKLSYLILLHLKDEIIVAFDLLSKSTRGPPSTPLVHVNVFCPNLSIQVNQYIIYII